MRKLDREQYLMLTLAEECAEVSQRVSKAFRFGMEEIQEGQIMNNRNRIAGEFNDLFTIYKMLEEEGYLPPLEEKLIDMKKKKVNKYYDYSIDVGMIDKGA